MLTVLANALIRSSLHILSLRYQCTAMSSLPSIIISLLYIIKLRQHCMAEATTEPVKCLIEDRGVAV